MKNKRYIILLCVIIGMIIISCHSNRKEIQKIVAQWYDKEVIIPPLTTKICGKDTNCYELLEAKYKLITYFDTVNCTGCQAHLYDWKLFIRETQAISSEISFIFIVHSQDYNEFVNLQKKNRFYYPVFYDPNGKFNELNHLSQNKNYHTFLLNKNNRIIAIGNPLFNTTLKKHYHTIIAK